MGFVGNEAYATLRRWPPLALARCHAIARRDERQRRFAVVILAAGQGTRMRSDMHKVLHPIASRPLLLHLLDRVDALGADKRVVVVGKGREQVEAALDGRDVTIAVQAEQKGTGARRPAGRRARSTGYDGPVLILYGDTPFVEAETLRRMLDRLDGDGGPGVVVLASRPADPAEIWPDHPRRRRPHRQDGRVYATRPRRSARSACAIRG